jgi:DNA-binding MarR family transcriptional regulator
MMHMHHAENTTCACTALRKASRAVTRLYDETMDETGMSIVQFSILRNIARHDALPLMQLADRLVMDRTTLYRALKPIEQRGWISLSDGGGRSKLASLTARGQKALQDATSAWQAAQARLLGRVGMQDWAAIEASLARLVEIASEAAP